MKEDSAAPDAPAAGDAGAPDLEAAAARADGIFSAPIQTKPDRYPKPKNFRREFKRAHPIYDNLSVATGRLYDDLRVGRGLDPALVERPLQEMIDSVIRNPDAMVWMRKLHAPDSYLIGHSARTAVLAVVLARGMGLAEAQLRRVAAGALYCQIGKTKLPTRLLEKRNPSEEEIERLHQYVELGLEILKACRGIDPEVIETVRNHHERFDGGGFPGGRAGDEIPLLARLVGLVEWYDAQTSLKPHSDQVMSATEAMDALFEQRNLKFQDQLVDEFIRALGIYPNGNLVELNNGEVALVQAQNPDHRTQPHVIIVRDERGKRLARYRALNLLEYNKNHDPLTIKRALAADELKLEPGEIMEATAALKRGWRKFF